MKMAVTVAVVGLDCGRRITGPRYSSTICPAAAGTFSWAPVLLSGCLHRVFSKEERQASGREKGGERSFSVEPSDLSSSFIPGEMVLGRSFQRQEPSPPSRDSNISVGTVLGSSPSAKS